MVLLYDEKQALLVVISHCIRAMALPVCALVFSTIASMTNLLPEAFSSVSMFVKHEWLPRGGYKGRLYAALFVWILGKKCVWRE